LVCPYCPYQAQAQGSVLRGQPPAGANIANLGCSDFAKSGTFFVRTSIVDFTFNPGNSHRFELLHSNGEVVYQYDFVSDLIRHLRPPIREDSGAEEAPEFNEPLHRQGPVRVLQLSAKDNLGRTAVVAVEVDAPLIRGLTRRRIFVPDSVNLRLEYIAPGTAKAPPQSESVRINNFTAQSDLTKVLVNPELLADIVNPTLFNEMVNPGLLPDLLVSQPTQVLAVTCLGCVIIAAGLTLLAGVAAELILTATAATAATAAKAAAAATGAVGAYLTTFGAFVNACLGACA
jgi:hypothetical protein